MKKTFSNRYIFIYSAVLVVVAALILTVVAVSLKPAQEKNQQAETKQMILKTIGIDATRDNAAELYAKHITEADGYYTFSGGIILPLHGTGLWGPIWGYLALDAESTVVGAVFDHKGETPGLGGEIASDKFAARFIGKRMDAEPIHLKKNADPANPYEVDAISGGTMTSNGVTAMLQQAYNDYQNLNTPRNQTTPNNQINQITQTTQNNQRKEPTQ
ncbi:MAG: FMN-binding protein [Bacteroidales bacterium]|nr:FMN-binding protein [Bacteroidales bacterium]